MEENKRAICADLLSLLQKTRAGRDIVDLEYHDNEFTDNAHVTIIWADRSTKIIDVTCDSGIAMIRDIIRHL